MSNGGSHIRRANTSPVSSSNKSFFKSRISQITNDFGECELQERTEPSNDGVESNAQTQVVSRSHTEPTSSKADACRSRQGTIRRLDEFLFKRNLKMSPHHKKRVAEESGYELHSEMEYFFKKIYDTKVPEKDRRLPFDAFWEHEEKGKFDKANFQQALDDFSRVYHVRITIQQIVQFRTLEDVYDSMRIHEFQNPLVDVQALHFCRQVPFRRGTESSFQKSTFAILEVRDETWKSTGYEVEIAVGELEVKVRRLLHALFLNFNQCGCSCCKVHHKFEVDISESDFFLNQHENAKGCDAFWEMFDLLKGNFKSLFWFVGVFFVIFCVEQYYGIEKLVEDLYDKAEQNRTYTLPYFLVIIFVWLIRAANGPGVSKSLITSSITILTCIFFPDAERWQVYAIAMPVDWLFDISLSLVQLAVAAPMMSASLYVLFEIFQYFVYVFHWMIFILWAVVLATQPDSTSDPAFFICVALFFYVIMHFIARLHYPRLNPDNFFGRWLMVPHDLRGNRNFIVQDYDKVIRLYIKRNRSLVHAWSKFWHYYASYYAPCLLKARYEGFHEKGSDADNDRRKMTPERCYDEISYLLYFWTLLWSVVYTVVSEMVILLDAVFLLIYDWRNLHGIMIIAVATLADIDRIYTIDAFYNFCQNGNLVDSASKIIWWKLFKMPLAWLICYMHAKWIELLWGLLGNELHADQG